MKCSIVPANVRDLTFIAANMREVDWQEIECQFPEGITKLEIAALAGQFGESWVALRLGQPVAAFGAAPLTYNVLSIWAWGTKGMARVIPAISRFIVDERVPDWIASGVTRVEARSHIEHAAAHRWMRSLGATAVPCPEWGRRGEDFLLFSWTRKDWDRSHVLLQRPQTQDRNSSATGACP